MADIHAKELRSSALPLAENANDSL